MRTRVLAAVLGAAALGMLVAGVTSYLVQRERIDGRIDDSLAQEVAEFREFASSGVDPGTGAAFSSVNRFLEVAVQRNIPDQNEGLLAMIDNAPVWVPATDVDLQLNEDPAFVRQIATMSPDEPIRPRTADTSFGSLRYVVVPVTLDGDPAQGRYVVAYSRDLEHEALADAYRTYAVVAAIAAVLIGGVGWWVTGRLLRPIGLLRQTAQRISDTDLSGRIPVTGHDEVSDLARTANAMLDRLEAAFANQRDALDDAGHELRTPITIIRGHLEVLDSTDVQEVDEVRSLVLDELSRMQRMVDDLVTLAKAKRPDFLRPRPVDLDRLADDVLDKARAMADRQWQVDARAIETVRLDEQRVTQAMLQLVSNAVKFTSAGDTIAVGSDVRGADVLLWVRDTGAGIASHDIERIFDRFTRVDTGRGEDGSGLGLAIVSAIAQAHHGRVSLDSAPGRGSRFTLVLPLVSDAETVEMVLGET